jgi:hypothetical protein
MNPKPRCRPQCRRIWAILCYLLPVGLSLLPLLTTSGAETLDPTKLPPPAAMQVDFLRDVQPILQDHCLKCHSGEKPKSNFRLINREAALRGGNNGVDIIVGNSAKSPLVYYVARLVEDMEMPPPGRGTPLTPEQVSLLRAWIDQGVSWTGATNPSYNEVAFSPTVGWTTVKGDARKFRELYWQPEGWNGGLENFHITEKPAPDSRITTEGHVLRDDYKLTLSAEKNDLGFTRLGWSQFRKYYDDTGGYYPLFNPSSYGLGRDLGLDVGRAWADLGLTLPRWPTIVFGYEYQYRNGTEATLQWGPVSNGGEPRSIYPGFKEISERVHIVKVDLDYEIGGVELSDRFRGEWYHLATQELDENLATNGAPAMPFTQIDERQKYFQGANSFHVEKQFADWFYGAGGYLYSKLDADGSMSMEQINIAVLDPTWPIPLWAWNASGIELERESHVFSLSGLLGPWQGFSLSLGTQNEWTRQTGFGTALSQLSSTAFLPPPNFTQQFTNIQNELSSLDHRVLSQSVGLRFTRLPFTTVFGEARFQQETYGQFAEESGVVTPFEYHTDAVSHMYDLRAGFETSPWRRVSLSGQIRRYDNETDYNNLYKLVGNPNEGYPDFIRWRDLLTTDAQGKLALQWTAWLKTTLSYDWLEKLYHTETESVTDFTTGLPGVAGGITTGAPLLAGKYDAHIASFNATMTPWRRLVLSGTFSFQNARTVTEANTSTAVVPYAGNIYSVLATGSYALGDRTTLIVAYGFSMADFGQADFQDGLPLGLTYHQHTLEAGLKRRLTKNATLGLQYRFYLYNEPSTGGLNNFQAHGVFATLTCRFP